MDNTGQIEIRVAGNEGKTVLSPSNYDIREIRNLMESVEDILYPLNTKERPVITYRMEDGSVRNIFTTNKQAVVQFAAVAAMIGASHSIDSLDMPTAKAIKNLQLQARTRNYTFDIKTSESEHVVLTITPQTKYEKSSSLWVDTELYFYGTLTDAGGKKTANIHLDTKTHGSLTIASSKEYLKSIEQNLLYREYGVRARGKQNAETGEIDKSGLELIELIDYSPAYDEDYLNHLISAASPDFINFDANEWLSNIRGRV
jgi:hypothetical protein